MSGILDTSPADLFYANHDRPRHNPGTVTQYNPKDGGPDHEYIYAQVETSNGVAPTQRRVVFWQDRFNGRARTHRTGADEDSIAGVIVAPVVTSGYYTWLRRTGKALVAAYGTFVEGDDVTVDDAGYATDKAGPADQTLGQALDPPAGALVGAATNIYIDLNIR